MMFTILRDNIPKRSCTPTLEVRSELKKNKLKLIGRFEEDEMCEMRCVNQTKFGYQSIGHWAELMADDVIETFCDNIEVRCAINATETYHYLHYQLVKKPKKLPPYMNSTDDVPSKSRPNLHVMLLDSVALPHFLRAMPRTFKYLKSSLSSYLFTYNNKAGLNSIPNGFVLYMDKLVEAAKADPLGKKLPSGKMRELNPCGRNTSYLARFFKENGYRTLLNEDWSIEIHKNCKAQQESYIDEFFNSYFNHKCQIWPHFFATERLGPGGRSHFHSNLWEPHCHERHLQQFDYLEQFMEMYKDEPIATFSWLTYLVHDWRGDLFGYDLDFLQFFERITPKLSNSHFILLADHGNRLYEERTFRLDRLEDNNPLLLYIPPQNLLKNEEFKNRLNENSRQLVTPYDTYATLKDIALHGHLFDDKYNFSSPPPAGISDNTGSSWLRPLKQPRNCDSLHIPYQYCLCKSSSEAQNITDDFKFKLAETCIQKMNKELKSNPKVAALCENLSVDRSYKPVVQKHGDKGAVYRVDFKTTPGGGLYDGYVQINVIWPLGIEVSNFRMFRLLQCVLLVIAIGLHFSSWNHIYAAPAKKHPTYRNLYHPVADVPKEPLHPCLCHLQNFRIEFTIHLSLDRLFNRAEHEYTKTSFIERPKINLEHSISYEEPKNADNTLENTIQNQPQWEQYNIKRQEETVDNLASENYKLRKKFVGYKALEEKMKPQGILNTYESRKGDTMFTFSINDNI
uniref:Sulfatase domain-containing protein n=1 Tax=Bursaphelenchus xylophilus TaxID=6326 RepID=A0A1I7S5S2_BURXY